MKGTSGELALEFLLFPRLRLHSDGTQMHELEIGFDSHHDAER